ncbi:DNA-binding domain-containing protein [Dyella sp.]|uniref:DNA-binding domain-containing protein n=1 Tax=Dyella sp. TaxID=1869338 RepID=UPI002ED2525C
MSSLAQIQQHVLQAVLADTVTAPGALKGDDRATAGTRLAIYHHAYRARLREALAIEYPGLALMAGKSFATLAAGYIEAHPSGHYNIRWHGAGLAAFLDYGLPWRERPALGDMARLDWAISTVFDAVDEPALLAQDLASLAPEDWATLQLHPQDKLQILVTPYNVAAFRKAADLGQARPRLRRHRQPVSLLIWRDGMEVRYRALDTDELAVLEAAIAGANFTELCDRLGQFHGQEQAPARMVQLLQGWLAGGLLRTHT